MSVHFTSPIWKHVDLPPLRKAVLLKVADNANDDGFAWPSVPRIAHETGYSTRTVKRVLKEFVEAGILEIRANEKGGRALPRVYWINLKRVTAVHPLPKFEPTGFEPFGPAKGDSHDAKGDSHNIKGDSQDTKGCHSLSPEPSRTIKQPSGEPSLARADTAHRADLDHFELTTVETNEDVEHDSKRTRRPTRLAADWEPTAKHFALGHELGLDAERVHFEADQFRDHAAAKGRTLKDWDAGFRMWIRKSADDRGGGASPARQGHVGGGRREPEDVAGAVREVNALFADQVAREPGDGST